MTPNALPAVAAVVPAVALTLSAAWSTPAAAEAVEFDFQDPKGVNGVVFVVDSKLEPITGMIGGVGGTVSYDPAEPTSFDGAVTVDLGEISFINAGMTKVLKGADWLDFTGAFVATMSFDEVLSATESDKGGQMLEVQGTMSFGGKEVPLKVNIDVTHLPDAAKDRGASQGGDLLVLRSMFNLSRIDLGINEQMPTDKVGETITVMVPIAGYSK
ncbi:MAG: YceI family protein [Planctomycetota bacterium]